MLDLVFQNFTKDKSFTGDFFENILKVGIEELNLKEKDIEVSLSLVDQGKIRELNKEYRNKDKATDVLSFPLETELLKKQGVLPLGDIFICLSFAKNEAKSENMSIEQKLAQLTAHGFLHLAGYDHEKSKKDDKEMRVLEDKILDRFN